MPRAKPPKNIVTVGLPSVDQFDFFKEKLPAKAPKRRTRAVVPTPPPEPEILEPVSDIEVFEPQRTAGSKETHVFSLYLRANGLMLKALMFFAVCAAVSIFVKAGVPFLQISLGPVTMPIDGFFFTGVMGLLDIIFACATAWFALRAAELGRLAGIPFRQTATIYSNALRLIGVGAFIVMVVLALVLTVADTVHLLIFVVNNAILHPNGYGEWHQKVIPAP